MQTNAADDGRPFHPGQALSDSGYVPLILDGKRPTQKDWTRRPAEVLRAAARGTPGRTNFGVRCGEPAGSGVVAALDFDIDDDSSAGRITEALANLGMPVRLGKPGRLLAVVRVPRDVRNEDRKFHHPDGRTGTVQLLAAGRQFVAFGVHPETGRPYTWPSCSIVDVAPEGLRLVKDATAFVDRLMRAAGWEPVAATPSSASSRQSINDEVLTETRRQDPEISENIERLRSALAAIPADCDYDQWRNVVFAVLSTGWQCAPGLAREWSITAPNKWDEVAFDTLATSYRDKPDGVTVGTLFHIARGYGWREPASLVPAQAVVGPAPDEEADGDPIHELNRKFCLAPVGADLAVWETKPDPVTGQRTTRPISRQSFALALANQKVEVARGDSTRKIAADKYFVEHRMRRQYELAEFAPGKPDREGVLNTWGGFAGIPAEGDVGLFLRLLEGLMPDAAARDYATRWMAFCVQHPGSRPDVALVLRGGRGIGKGSAARLLLDIFGAHGRHVTQAKHLTGNFNAHLADAAFVFVDEAIWAGDRGGEGALKALITEPTILIERKGFDVVSASNRMKVMFASNESWVVPAGADERRFAVFDCGDGLRGDRKFFAEFNDWVGAGGACAVLHYLLAVDLARWEPRDVPHTEALDHQKIESLTPLDAFVWDRLGGDCALDCEDAPWSEEVRRSGVQARFVEYVRNAGRRYVKTSTAEIGRRLRELIGAEEGPRRREGGDRSRTWTVPPLDEARRRTARALGLRPPGVKA